MRTAAIHASTRAFGRRLDEARRVADALLEKAPHACVAWSGGKDSTCLAHLVVVDRGARDVVLVSEKDDLDYPGEEDYVQRLACEWGADLRIVHPNVSPAEWFRSHAAELLPGDDIHARSAGLSKACFYSVVEAATGGFAGLMMGLRAAESSRRSAARKAHGKLYRVRSGQWRASPIGDWDGLDVLAYAESRGVELLHVYRCIGFMHANDPWNVRKSWWLPGKSAAYGQVAWLRRYYPSLHRKLMSWMPRASMFG